MPQKNFAPLLSARGVRLDVYVSDGDKVYDVEIQNRNEPALGKRGRYYQGMMDVDSLLRGQDFDQLKGGIVIFLCRFDPFKKGISCYTVKRMCCEDASVDIADGASAYIFNCTAYEKAKK